MEKTSKNKIAIDFDGVLHTYDKGWQDGSIYGEPLPHAVAAITTLAEDYELVIFTCRTPASAVYDWVKEKFGIAIPVTNAKPHADMYIDDRGYHFVNWIDAMHTIRARDAKTFKRQAIWREEFNRGYEQVVPNDA